MIKQNELAINLMNLFKESSYKEFSENFFINRPNLSGYYFIFTNVDKPKFCLILNESSEKYDTNMLKTQDFIYIVFNVSSLKEFLQSLTTNYLETILNIVNENIAKKNPRGLPYGYYTDVNGRIKIDLKKAQEVKEIYNLYEESGSVRKIVKVMNSNFSHVRNILRANDQYMEMQDKIVPISTLKRVNEILAQNVKGKFKEEKTIDKIRAMRKEREQKEKEMGLK